MFFKSQSFASNRFQWAIFYLSIDTFHSHTLALCQSHYILILRRLHATDTQWRFQHIISLHVLFILRQTFKEQNSRLCYNKQTQLGQVLITGGSSSIITTLFWGVCTLYKHLLFSLSSYSISSRVSAQWYFRACVYVAKLTYSLTKSERFASPLHV